MTSSPSELPQSHGYCPSPAIASPFWGRFRFLLVGLVTFRGLILLCLLPPFEGWDEYQHVGYLQHLSETGQSPRFGAAMVSPVLLEEVSKFPLPEKALANQLEKHQGLGYRSYWERLDQVRGATGQVGQSDAPIPLYQAQHSSLYYRLVLPAYSAMGGATNLRLSVAGLRAFNLAMLAASVWIAAGVIRRAVTRERDAALIALVLAVHSLFLMNGVRVSNDALGVLLATASIAAGLSITSCVRRDQKVLRSMVTGVLIGLAILAKATNLALIPAAAALILLALATKREKRIDTVLSACAIALAILAVTFNEISTNLTVYGMLTPMQEAITNRQAGRTAHDLFRTAMTMEWPRWLEDLWGRRLFFVGGWSFVTTMPGLVMAYRILLRIGLLGWGIFAVSRLTRIRSHAPSGFRSWRFPVAGAFLILSYSMALGYHRVQSELAWGAASTCAWYASPALPWLLTFVIVGAFRLPLGSWLGTIVAFAMVADCLAAEFVGMFGGMISRYTDGAPWTLAMERLAMLQPAWLGTPTLALAFTAQVLVLAMLLLVLRDARRARRGRDEVPLANPHPLSRPVFRRTPIKPDPAVHA